MFSSQHEEVKKYFFSVFVIFLPLHIHTHITERSLINNFIKRVLEERKKDLRLRHSSHGVI